MSKELTEVILKQQEQIEKLSSIVEMLNSQIEILKTPKEEIYSDDWLVEQEKLRKLNSKMPKWIKDGNCLKCHSKREIKFSNLSEYDYSCDCDKSDKRLKSVEIRIKHIEQMLDNPNKVIVGHSLQLEKLITERLNDLEKIKKKETEISAYSDIMKVIEQYKEKYDLNKDEQNELVNVLKETYKISGSVLKEI